MQPNLRSWLAPTEHIGVRFVQAICGCARRQIESGRDCATIGRQMRCGMVMVHFTSRTLKTLCFGIANGKQPGRHLSPLPPNSLGRKTRSDIGRLNRRIARRLRSFLFRRELKPIFPSITTQPKTSAGHSDCRFFLAEWFALCTTAGCQHCIYETLVFERLMNQRASSI
jgi:hypothetical protein